MKCRRIHITGAPGAGVTTLGRALATRLGLPHHDTDDYYWCPTDPPYRRMRAPAERLRLMEEVFLASPDWVLSGSVVGWGETVAPLFDLVVFVTAPTELRLTRLRDRETRRFGAEVIGPGGWRHAEAEEFFEWASHYDDDSREGRSRSRHEAWLETLAAPVLRVEGVRATEDLVAQVVRGVDLPA